MPETASGSTATVEEGAGQAVQAAHEDPFGMHLIGTADATTGGGLGHDSVAGTSAEKNAAEPNHSTAEAGEGTTASPTHDGGEANDATADVETPGAQQAGEPAPIDAHAGAAGDPADAAGEPNADQAMGAAADAPSAADVPSPSSDSPVAHEPPVAVAPAPTAQATGDGQQAAEANVGDVARTQVGLIQAHAASEYLNAVNAIGQREQVLRGTFAQQRAAILTVAGTQAALARSEAKAAGERVRGRNGAVGKTIAQLIDADVARLSHGTQDAMVRVTTASRAVHPVIRVAANNALANANLDLRDANEGVMANELYQRLIPKATTAARQEVNDARSRDIDRLASTRDSNIRQMRRAGDILASQVAGELRPVEQQIAGSGEKVAALIDNNARSLIAAIVAAERDSAAFFARARANARQLIDAGRSTAATLTSAAAAQAGTPGAAARFQSAASQAAPHLAGRRERLVASVDSVVDRATSTASHGLSEFQGECGVHRALALGNYAVIEGTLAGNIAGKVGQIRAEWSKETDVAITGVNSFAAVVESNRSALAAQLPLKFGNVVRSAFSEARKSRLTRFGEGVWGAVSGLVTTVAKFVAAALIIAFAPFVFGVAALIGKAGALAGIVRDAAMAVVGMAQAFAERFKVLFRTWDDWPWYGKVAGLWATTLVAVGDVIGLPSIYEGVSGKELISNRELSYDERGAKTFGGGFAALTTLVPTKIHADKAARASAAREMGRELGELEAQSSAASEAAASTPESPTTAAARQAEQRVILQGTDAEIAELAQKIEPEPGTLDVYVHGTVDDFVVHHNGKPVHLDHKRLANYIRKSGAQPERIRLISCSTGAHAKGAAQHLANQMKMKVVAPSDILHINRKTGKMTIGPSAENPSGGWVEFEPTKSEFRYSPWKEKPNVETRYERFLRERAEKLERAKAGVDEPSAATQPEPAAEVATDDLAATDVPAGEHKPMGSGEPGPPVDQSAAIPAEIDAAIVRIGEKKPDVAARLRERFHSGAPQRKLDLKYLDQALARNAELADAATQHAMDRIAEFRRASGLPEFAPADGTTGTIARLEVGGQEFYGANGEFSQGAKPLRRDVLKRLQEAGLGDDIIGKTLADVRAMSHAEAHVIILAHEVLGELPSQIVVYVDRVTCNFCLGANGVDLLRQLYGFDELVVVDGTGVRTSFPRRKP